MRETPQAVAALMSTDMAPAKDEQQAEGRTKADSIVASLPVVAKVNPGSTAALPVPVVVRMGYEHF